MFTFGSQGELVSAVALLFFILYSVHHSLYSSYTLYWEVLMLILQLRKHSLTNVPSGY